MQIDELKVTVGEVCEGYFNDAEEGVVGYDERLDIRPKYQREFVYKDTQRDEVIRTVMKGLPLNVIYWCKVKKDDGSDGLRCWTDSSVQSPCVSMWTVPSLWTISISITCRPTRNSRFSITLYSYMSVTVRTARNWTGSVSSISRGSS